MISTQGELYFSVVTEKYNRVCVCGGEITVRVTQLMILQGCWCHLLRAFYSCSDSEGVSTRPHSSSGCAVSLLDKYYSAARSWGDEQVPVPMLGNAGDCQGWNCHWELWGLFSALVFLLNYCTQALKLQLLSVCVLRDQEFEDKKYISLVPNIVPGS